MERLFSRAFLARKVTFSLGMVEWLSETSSELKTTLTKKKNSWLFIDIHFIFSMRQQQQINMQASLSLHHVIQIMVL